MIDRSLIGRESEGVVHEVERGAIRRFAEAVGDSNRIYVDEEAARAAGHPTVVAPPTFPVTLTMNEKFRASLGLEPGRRSLLHSEQQFEYGRPILAGDRITVKTRVADVQEHEGASGSMHVLVLEDEGRDPQGAMVFRSRTVLVHRRG